jgi:hypothetical protein
MEDIVNLLGQRKPQMEHHWGDDLCYFKWPFPSGGQLPGGVAESQVAPFEPYLISDFPRMELGRDLFPHGSLCLLVCSQGFLSCFLHFQQSRLKGSSFIRILPCSFPFLTLVCAHLLPV